MSRLTDIVLEPPSPAARSAAMRAHAWRSLNVGAFAMWAVVIDRLLDGAPIGWPRVVGIYVLGTAAFFVIGSGSGVLWSYLPQSRTRREDDSELQD